MAWSNDNKACLVTWGILAVLQQTEEAFADTGEIFIPGLFFWNPNDRDEVHKMMARSLASEMEELIRLVFQGKVIDGKSPVEAMSALAEILANQDKKVEDLAAKVGALYSFPGEVV